MRNLTAATWLFAVGAVVGQQPNTFFATVKVDGNDGPVYPMSVNVRTATTSTISVSGSPNSPFLIALSTTGNLQLFSAPIFGGKLDLPFNPPVVVWFNGFFGPGIANYKVAPIGVTDISVAIPGNMALNSHVALQGLVADPTNPAGASLTAATQTTMTQGPVITPLSFTDLDEGYAIINLTGTGLTVPFYGTSYSYLQVYTNGYIHMANNASAPGSDFVPSTSAFASAAPRIAPFWCDQWLTSGGTCIGTYDANPPNAPGYVRVDYYSNWDYGSPLGFPHNYSVLIDHDGGVEIIHPFTNGASLYFQTIVGIGPGNNLGSNNQTAKDLSALVGTSYVGAVNENFFQFFDSAGGVSLPAYDLSGVTMTWFPNGIGAYPANTNAYVML